MPSPGTWKVEGCTQACGPGQWGGGSPPSWALAPTHPYSSCVTSGRAGAVRAPVCSPRDGVRSWSSQTGFKTSRRRSVSASRPVVAGSADGAAASALASPWLTSAVLRAGCRVAVCVCPDLGSGPRDLVLPPSRPQSLFPDTRSEQLGLGACGCWWGGTRSAHNSTPTMPDPAGMQRGVTLFIVGQKGKKGLNPGSGSEGVRGWDPPAVSGRPGHSLLCGGPSWGSVEGEQVRQGRVSVVGGRGVCVGVRYSQSRASVRGGEP